MTKEEAELKTKQHVHLKGKLYKCNAIETNYKINQVSTGKLNGNTENHYETIISSNNFPPISPIDATLVENIDFFLANY